MMEKCVTLGVEFRVYLHRFLATISTVYFVFIKFKQSNIFLLKGLLFSYLSIELIIDCIGLKIRGNVEKIFHNILQFEENKTVNT